jgi:hypothetical protein
LVVVYLTIEHGCDIAIAKWLHTKSTTYAQQIMNKSQTCVPKYLCVIRSAQPDVAIDFINIEIWFIREENTAHFKSPRQI